MPELTTTATFTDGQFDEEALTTIVARSVLEAALAEDEGAELWFEIGRDGDDETARLAVELSAADLEEILRLSGADDVALALDGQYVAGLFDDDPEVEGHGLRGAIAIAVTSAAILAPAAQAAVPQATQQAEPQTTAQATAQVSAATTAQVSSLAARTQATLQNRPQSKAQVSKAQLAKVSGLKLLRSGLAR
jgi:pyruvate/2-oxoglutarate dehydrogenase complex dihydrolipoamide acyltransferase (E2) component